MRGKFIVLLICGLLILSNLMIVSVVYSDSDDEGAIMWYAWKSRIVCIQLDPDGLSADFTESPLIQDNGDPMPSTSFISLTMLEDGSLLFSTETGSTKPFVSKLFHIEDPQRDGSTSYAKYLGIMPDDIGIEALYTDALNRVYVMDTGSQHSSSTGNRLLRFTGDVLLGDFTYEVVSLSQSVPDFDGMGPGIDMTSGWVVDTPGFAIDSYSLYSVDYETGASSYIGSTVGPYATHAINSSFFSDGKSRLYTITGFPQTGGTTSTLNEIDPDTGATIRNLGSGPSGVGLTGGLAPGPGDEPDENEPPVADAGSDQTVNEGDVVQFNGSGSYGSDNNGEISSSGWDIQVVDSQDDVGRWASLAVDANGNPQISYWDYSNKDLKHTKWTGTDWNTETIDSAGYVGHYTSMAMDTNGYPHISYVDYTNDALKYAKWTGTAWLIENVDNNGWYNSLTLDSQGRPHISYYGDHTRGLMYAKWTGSSWNIEKVGSQTKHAIHTAITLDSNDYPHISYDNNIWGNSTFEYAKWTGSTWNIEILDHAGNFGQYNSITIDGNDHPHISYSDRTNGHLKYAMWDGSIWKIEIVDDIGLFRSGFVHRASSIKLDINDIPHISFYDSKNGTLKYAIKNGSSWIVEIIDNEGDVGYDNSFVLQDGEIPHIAYRDNTNGDLKYATRPTGGSSQLTYSWDFNNYVDSNSDGDFTNDVDATGPNPTHIYGDDGVFTVTLQVTDNDNLSATDTCNITVLNVNPEVILESTAMKVEIGLRVAGSKWSNVGMTLYEDEIEIGYIEVERWPGSPDDNPSYVNPSLPTSLDMTKSYRAVVTYDPFPDSGDEIRGDQPNNGKDKQNNAGNPVWIVLRFPNGSEEKAHHTFNTQQSMKRNSDHPNHVEPWEVDIMSLLVGHTFEVSSHVTDPGSDDEILTFTYGSQNSVVTHLCNTPNADPYPSPEINPRDIYDTAILVYEGAGTLTLVVKDDDNIRLGVGEDMDSIELG